MPRVGGQPRQRDDERDGAGRRRARVICGGVDLAIADLAEPQPVGEEVERGGQDEEQIAAAAIRTTARNGTTEFTACPQVR